MLADVIVVTYHSAESASQELDSFVQLASSNDPRLSWSFVDNSEDSSDADYLEQTLTAAGHTRVLRRADNPGFAAACNEAAQTSEAEWVLFVNPDILLTESSLDTILAHVSATPPEVSCVAISQQTGPLAHQGVSFNRAGWFMDRPLHRSDATSSSRASVYRAVGGAGRLLGPSGGAAAFRRETFLRMGGFYEALFAWGEDADLAMRLHLNGEPCAGLDILLPHQGGHSVTAGRVSRRRAQLLVSNRITIAARLYSLPQGLAFAAFLGAVLVAKTPRMLRNGTLGAHWAGVAKATYGLRRARASYTGPRLRLVSAR
ncbi:MAG: glycosyltransferase [Ornithinimicrobium sp.]